MIRILLVVLAFFPVASWAQTAAQSNDFWDRGWEVATAAERQRVLDEMELDSLGVDESLVSVAAQPMPWSPQLRLFRVSGGWSPDNLMFYFVGRPDGELTWLDGTSPPIHELNAQYTPQFSQRTAAQYVWFFGFFVRGDAGPFLVAESAEDTFVPEISDLSGAQLADGARSLDELLTPLTCVSDGSTGGFVCPATVYYSDAIYTVVFRVAPTGMVEMLGDSARAADLPVLVNAPITFEDVEAFEPQASGWISEQVAQEIVDGLSSSEMIDWSVRNNYVMAGVSSALIGRCRTELSGSARGSLVELVNFALAGLMINTTEETPRPQPAGGLTNTSVLGLGMSLLEGLDCETEADDLAFNILFHRLSHLTSSPFLEGCMAEYDTSICLCYANGSSTVDPEMIAEPFSYARVEEFFDRNMGVAYSVLYTCGELVR